jgi:gliding motility-associated-like protein
LKRNIFIYAFCFGFQLVIYSQYSGIVNHYLKVLDVQSDRVKVANTTGHLNSFQGGDYVLLIQMTGAEVSEYSETQAGTLSNAKNCGKFEFLQMDEKQIVGPDTFIVFTHNVSGTYDVDQKIQLIRVLVGDTVNITGTVTAKSWDGNTGGILAIIGLDVINLNADVDVTGKGFRGGQAENDYPLYSCRPNPDTVNWPSSATGRAGYKGEGIITTSFPFTKGAGHALNGGGGGNGLFSGGGGGSNYLDGGVGGCQWNAYCIDNLLRSNGGYNLASANKFYRTDTRQIIMGGGGGAGTQNTSGSYTATAGGNGGGIIMLITETLIGNNRNIIANGQDVNVTATASGGGGGAGGTVLIDAATYSGSFTVQVKGGKGGNTANCTGAGGGGSGGVLWHSDISFPSVTIDTTRGIRGSATGVCPNQYGTNGSYGTKLKSLLLPLSGFLFNTIRDKDTICAGQVPNQLRGSNPKGGNGIYTYKWEQSTDSIVWVDASGAATLTTFQPNILYQTTFFRRVVNSVGISDTSRPVKVFVYPAISNNVITGTDTICYNKTAKTITGTVPPALTGGNGNYSYSWERSSNNTDWDAITGATASSYNPGNLTATRYYRRLVTSTLYCSSTSSSVKITVLPSITSNTFYGLLDTTICQLLSPGPLYAKTPGGGDGLYHYKWQNKVGLGNWQDIAGSDVVQYNPGNLNETTYFRRIVFSGNDNACIDTSVAKNVNVLPFISNNIITTDSLRYCAGNNPDVITGLLPAGGNNTYSYKWQIKTSGDWITLSNATGQHYDPVMVEHNPTQFRRIVSSGILGSIYVCNDTSAPVSLEVIPYINNRLDLTDQSICQYNTPLPLNPDAPTGGYGGFTYQWMAREEGLASWNNAAGISNLQDYVPGTLTKTTYFVRKVKSDICEHISDTVTVIVYPIIKDNFITGQPVQYTCYNTSSILNGSTHTGGKTGDYTYLWQQSTDQNTWNTASGNPLLSGKNFESTALTDSLFFRRIVFSSASIKECKDTSNPVLIRINPLPQGDMSLSFVDTLCSGESLFFPVDVSGGKGPWKVTIGQNELQESKENISTLHDSVSIIFPAGDYQISMLAVEDDNGCLADPTGFLNMARIKVFQMPQANAGEYETYEVCGNNYSLHAVFDIPQSKGLWSAEGGVFSDSTMPVTNVTLNHYGKSVLTWTETNWRCADSDTVGILFDEQPVVADAGPDQTLDFIYTTKLNALVPQVGKGKWTVVEGAGQIDDNTMPDATIIELSEKNLLRWTVKNGVCPEIKDSMIIIINPLKIHKGFSPNGDGINDLFIIPTTNAEKISIKIYNRAGIIVFESDDYNNGDLWDGKAKNGIDLPEGTYYYVMDVWVKGRSKPVNIKSFIEILR